MLAIAPQFTIISETQNEDIKHYKGSSFDCGIKMFQLKNCSTTVTGNLKINSKSAKFYQLKLLIIGNLDILIVTEIFSMEFV